MPFSGIAATVVTAVVEWQRSAGFQIIHLLLSFVCPPYAFIKAVVIVVHDFTLFNHCENRDYFDNYCRAIRYSNETNSCCPGECPNTCIYPPHCHQIGFV